MLKISRMWRSKISHELPKGQESEAYRKIQEYSRRMQRGGGGEGRK